MPNSPDALPERCIFCGLAFGPERPRSKEHIWPKWMHSLLPEKQGAQRLFAETEPIGTRPFGRVLHKHFKPQVVCEPCNNRWMSHLEIATKPILLPLMLGEAQHINSDAQATLATWACLKSMVAEFSDPATRATSAADLKRMYDEHLPPPQATLWIGEHAGTEWTTRYRHQGMRISHGVVRPGDGSLPNGQVTTFAVGRVIFHLLTLPDGFLYGGVPVSQGPIAECIGQIYPSTPPFDWPFARTLTDADALDLGDKMTEAYKYVVEGAPRP